MKKLFLLILISTLCGCATWDKAVIGLDDLINSEPIEEVEPVPEPIPDPVVVPEPIADPVPADGLSGIVGGSNTFLWKPVDHNGGPLVILTPAKYQLTHLMVNGQKFKGPGTRANNERQHWRSTHKGEWWGNNVKVDAYAGTFLVRTWVVPFGAQRKQF